MKMKWIGAILFALCCGGSAWAQTATQPAPSATVTTDVVTLKKNQIAQAHHALFELPYSKEYIRDVIIAEIKQNRGTVAPHFPERKAETDIHTIDAWIADYPQEVNAYIRYIELTHRKYAAAKP